MGKAIRKAKKVAKIMNKTLKIFWELIIKA